MRGRTVVALGVPLLLVAAVAVWGVRGLRLASAATSEVLCASHFIERLDAADAFDDELAGEAGMALVRPALSYQVDEGRREVRTRILGLFSSRAVMQEGWGCQLVRGQGPPPLPPAPPWPEAGPLLPELAGPAVVEPADASLRAALDDAFREPAAGRRRRTKAVVIVYQGRVLAERYAPGYSPATPLWGHSMTKSVTSALIGLLVRDGKLRLEAPAPFPWTQPSAGREAITTDQLLRMTSGLAADEEHGLGDRALPMWFLADDMERFAEGAKLAAAPGTRWAYSNAGYQIASRLVRDAAGGTATAALDFVRRELFGPLGMRSAVLEFDATGTPVGSRDLFATARDWARFGLLYAQDGVVGGKQLLPAGWVRYSGSRTLQTGYGAGLWTSLEDGEVPGWGLPWSLPGAPREALVARGYHGQWLVIVPSRRLVLVRLGASPGGDPAGVGRLLAAVLAALPVGESGG